MLGQQAHDDALDPLGKLRAFVAGRFGLEQLTVIAIDNKSSSLGWPGGIAARFAVEGWSTDTVNGRDHAEIEHALTREHARQPHVVVAEVEKKS